MQSLANQRGSSAAFRAGKQASSRPRVVNCHAKHAQHKGGEAALAAAGLVAASCLMGTPMAQAAQPLQHLAEVDGAMTLAVGGSAAVAGLGALLVATDPQKRCDRDRLLDHS